MIFEEFYTTYHENFSNCVLEMLGLTATGAVLLVLTEILKYAEFKKAVPLGMASRADSYSAI